jgi:hypothetical protein
VCRPPFLIGRFSRFSRRWKSPMNPAGPTPMFLWSLPSRFLIQTVRRGPHRCYRGVEERTRNWCRIFGKRWAIRRQRRGSGRRRHLPQPQVILMCHRLSAGSWRSWMFSCGSQMPPARRLHQWPPVIRRRGRMLLRSRQGSTSGGLPGQGLGAVRARRGGSRHCPCLASSSSRPAGRRRSKAHRRGRR